MKIKTIPLAVVVLAAFTFGIAGSSALGYWITESTKTPARMTTGEFAGQYDPSDIRGSYSFGDVQNAFGIPASVLAEAFGFTDRPAAEVKAKDLETVYAGRTGAMEVGTDSVRFFVAAWLGIPFDPEPTTILTARAAAILLARDLHPATAALVQSRTFPGDSGFGTLSAAPAAPPVPPSSPAPAGTGTGIGAGTFSTDREVKGRTTFGDLYAWGLSNAQVKDALGGREPGAASQAVRDYCAAEGIEFSDIRTRLQAMIDGLTKS